MSEREETRFREGERGKERRERKVDMKEERGI